MSKDSDQGLNAMFLQVCNILRDPAYSHPMAAVDAAVEHIVQKTGADPTVARAAAWAARSHVELMAKDAHATKWVIGSMLGIPPDPAS